MTAHAHDTAPHTDRSRPSPSAVSRPNGAAARPRWLLPGLLAGVVVAGLVIAGVLSISVVIYAGLFGGMMLMHLGGHGGHGGHGGQSGPGGGHAVDDGPASEARNLSDPSSDPQVPGPDSGGEPDDRASAEPDGNERQSHDRHDSHGCH